MRFKSSGLVIADADTWLAFPKRLKPPGGFGVLGMPASTPEEAADRLAARKLAMNHFVNLQEVYAEVNAEYAKRPGSPNYTLARRLPRPRIRRMTL